jgi:hypothetical protein
MKKIIVFVFVVALLFASAAPILARSGCCSHHGGVCGCGCCDGSSLSSTCAPYYPQCSGGNNYVPVYQTRQIIYPTSTPIPSDPILRIKASINYDYNEQRDEYSIKFDWDDLPGNKGYSVFLTKYPGLDPGSLIDTHKSVWRFNNLKSGIWYANLKSFNGYSWSQIVYWTINLPNKKQPTLNSPTKIPAVPSYRCNCSKTCTQISTCAEAYYQLNTCGCSVRDGDGDGVPCENLCR